MKLSIRLAIKIIIVSVLFVSGESRAFMFWNQACSFSGSANSYISVPNSPTLNITQSFSIDTWIMPSNILTPPAQIIAEKRSSSSTNGYSIYLLNGRVAIRTNGVTRLIGGIALQNNAWSHIAATYNSTNGLFSIFVNGVLDTTVFNTNATPLAVNDSLRIGKGFVNSPFSGWLDEFRIWSAPLTGAELLRVLRTTLGTSTGVYDPLVLSLTFQDKDALGAYQSLADWSGNGNNGNGTGVLPVDLSDRPSSTIALNDCVQLDGANDLLTGNDNSSISPTQGVTLEAWIFPTSVIGFRVIMHKGPLGGSANYGLRMNSGFLYGVINGNQGFSSEYFVEPNKWTHVAFTYDGANGRYRFYVNGALTNQGVVNVGNITNGSEDLLIGSSGSAGSFYQGLIDEVRIANYVKDQARINKYLFRSIEQSNEPNPSSANVVYNLDGYAFSNCDAGPELNFVSDACFRGSSTVPDSPVSPLNRSDANNYSQSFMLKTSFENIPSSGTSGIILDSFEVCLDTIISDLNLSLNLNHKNEEELEVYLVSPAGLAVQVHDNNILAGVSDNVITIYDDQADSSVFGGPRYTSFAPSVKPSSSLNAAYTGKRTAGYWKIVINDQTGPGTGVLYSWGIQFNNAPVISSNLCLRVFMEGFYREEDSCVADTVDVYIRESSAPYEEVGVKGETPDDNFTFRYTFDSASIGTTYYLQVRHRNSIQIWSANPVTFDFLNGNLRYDFTVSADSAFGSNQVQVDDVPLRYAMYGGDVNQDDIIDGTDTQLIDNDAAIFGSGYIVTDVNGDNFVDGTDASITGNNADAFITAITP